MKSLSLIATLALMCAASALQAAEPVSGSGAAPAAAKVTPANDPQYTYKTPRLNRAAFDSLTAEPEKVLVLDIRRPDELTKTGGFPVYLSIQTNDVLKELAFIPRDRKIVTVSNRAHRAGAVGDQLALNGYQVAGAIGVLDYEDEGGKLTKIAPPVPNGATASAEAPATQVR